MESTFSKFDQYFDASPIIKPVSYAPHVDLQEKTNYALVIYMNEQSHTWWDTIRTSIQSMVKRLVMERMRVFQQDTTIRFNTPWDYEPLNNNDTFYPL